MVAEENLVKGKIKSHDAQCSVNSDFNVLNKNITNVLCLIHVEYTKKNACNDQEILIRQKFLRNKYS